MASKNGKSKVFETDNGWRLELISPLLQRNVEDISEPLTGKSRMAVVRFHGELVRAALASGWVISLTPELPDDLGEADPALVNWIAESIDSYYQDSMAIPKN